MIHPIGYTRNKISIHVDLIHSAAANTIGRQPHLLTLLAEALPGITIRDEKHIIEYDMGRPIGYNFIAKTTPDQTVFYAKLINDNLYTRFVKHAKPLVSSYLTMQLQRDSQDSYLLQDVWIGRAMPSRPGSPNESPLSKSYWAEHALIFDSQPIQARTLTKDCPY
jgi:hypothetical protein